MTCSVTRGGRGGGFERWADEGSYYALKHEGDVLTQIFCPVPSHGAISQSCFGLAEVIGKGEEDGLTEVLTLAVSQEADAVSLEPID
jgi:hypothetical protein